MTKHTYINYVKQIYTHKSLTGAAKALGISQPALSQGLSSLEKELGFKIFDRKTNPISLTEEGKIYYEYICRMDTLTDSFKKQLNSLSSMANKHVIIGAPVVYVDNVVTPAVVSLLSEHPEYKVTIKTASLEELIELKNNGHIDLFISTSKDLPSNLTSEKLYTENIMMCIPKEDSVNKELHKKIDFNLLKNHRFIFLEDNFPLQIQINDYFKKIDFTADNSIVVDQVSLAINLADQGIGICFAPDKVASTKNLEIYNIGIQGRDIYISYDKDIFLSDAAKDLITSIKK